jgi:hypothetical protein
VLVWWTPYDGFVSEMPGSMRIHMNLESMSQPWHDTDALACAASLG